MKIETFTGKDGKYYFHLVGTNGQTILSSQDYNRKWNRNRSAKRVANAFNVPVEHTD